MRLGGPVFPRIHDPEEWIAALRAEGYRAAYCPLEPGADSFTVRAYREAAHRADIVIAEVGAWSNPLSPDPSIAAGAIEKCEACLALADEIGARCCVNIAGSRGSKWDGPHPDNLTEETFDQIVITAREIIDAVKPQHTFYTLETMPWIYPNSADAYLRLIRAVDRRAFAVHFDPVNLITSLELYYSNSKLIEDFVSKLAPYIRSCHAKDILLEDRLTLHLAEVRPGLGYLDYPALLQALNRLDPDLPLMLEHLPSENEYRAAAQFIRGVATAERVTI